MNQSEMRANGILLLAAAIWGFAFVAQRVGGQYVGSFTFNGIRFALGSFSLVPLILFFSHQKKPTGPAKPSGSPWLPGLIAGCVLFTASSLQQVGLVDTSAGRAAFITGMYIVLVPVIGIFLKHRIHSVTWIGVSLTAVGLYCLSVNEGFAIARGDLLEFCGAFFWSIHILVIDYFIQKTDSLKLSAIQCLTCSILSLGTALIFEDISWVGIRMAVVPILYGGICSVGIAYTLQIVGQKYAKPSHAAVILSMEAVFASLGGLLILHEQMGLRGYIGCLLMLAGMLLAQLPGIKKRSDTKADVAAA